MTKHVFIIAEIGSVHDGKLAFAKELATAAHKAGADCIKFQTHIAEAETLPNAPSPSYFNAEPRFAYFKRTGFTLEQWKELKEHCESIGAEFMSSPFSEEAVDLLEKVGMKRYKIPSGEVTNIPLLEKIAATKKPVILSSGMSDWKELDAAVNIFTKSGNDLTVLQCTSEYPCPYEKVGLNVLTEMKDRYKLPVGLSDHTLTVFAPIAAVITGATVIEKHFTTSRDLYGSDAKHSLEPREFADMVEGIRAAEIMLTATVDMSHAAGFAEMKKIFEKSVVSLTDIPEGAVITAEMVACKKPGTGIPARELPRVIGSRALSAIPRDSLIDPKALEWAD